MAENWTQEDNIADIFKDMDLKPRLFWFFKNRPVIAGEMTFKLNMLLQEGGINLGSARNSILYPAHLYNATRYSADMQAAWKDRDYVISVHSPQRVFVGSPPTEPSEYLKRFMVTLGTSASFFARNRRRMGRSLVVESQRGPRSLKTTSPAKDAENAALTTPNLVAVIANACIAERTSQPAVELQEFSRQMIVQQYTPIQLLQIVRESLAAEELHLLFDYFSLHQRSVRLLRILQTHFHEKMECFPEAYIEDESQLPYVIGSIFEIAAGSDRVVDLARIPAAIRASKLLCTAADVLTQFLEVTVETRVSLRQRHCRTQ